MRRLFLLFLPAVCVAATTAVTVEQLVTMAKAAPGEFAAEALIRVTGMDKVEKTRKIELLQDAFGRAGEAQLLYKQRSAISKIPGPAGIFNRVGAQGLDGLSLRLKATNAMLPLDPKKAREMFLRIPPVNLPHVQCTSFLVYDVDAFYDTLEHIAKETYSDAEVEKGEPFRLMLPYVTAITSPVQLPGAARMIAASKVNDKDFAALMSAFSKSMAKMDHDDRSFTFAAAGPQIRAVMLEGQKRELPVAPMLESYRLYLVNNMTGQRCADDDLMNNEGTSFAFADPRGVETQGFDVAAYFNAHLRMPPLQEIHEEETTPSKVTGAASGLRACDDSACKAIVEKYLDLIYDSQRNPYPTRVKESQEWIDKLHALLKTMAAWGPMGPAFAAAHFREKSALYSDLSNIPPNPLLREVVLRAQFEFVRKNKAAAANRAEWFLPVNALIGRVTLDPMGLGRLTDDLLDANDPVVTMFVNLDALAPRTAAMIMPLF